MAKRRRLTPPTRTAEGPQPDQGAPATRIPFGAAPIAQIAGDSAEQAVLRDVTQALESARQEGRLAQPLPLSEIVDDHLVRARVALDEDDLQALQASLSDRGQQTPIDVVRLEDGRYGLISGWRRVTALRRNGAETVLGVIRQPDTAAETYQAMVEENEIRAGLSYWERAHIAARAAELGVYPDVSTAIARLFAHASRAKRSKIGSFATLIRHLESVIAFPNALPVCAKHAR